MNGDLQAEIAQIKADLAGMTSERDALIANVRLLKDDLAAATERYYADMQAIDSAIGTCAFMDPPDGGSPSLAEQVSRMRKALDKADADAAQWKERAEKAERGFDNLRNGSGWQDERNRADTARAEADALAHHLRLVLRYAGTTAGGTGDAHRVYRKAQAVLAQHAPLDKES